MPFSVLLFSASFLWSPVSSTCTLEIERVHGVWLDGQVFLPFYNDLDLAAYLTTVFARVADGRTVARRALVLPVYSGERLMLVRDGRLLISTGMLLELRSEKDLAAALKASKTRGSAMSASSAIAAV